MNIVIFGCGTISKRVAKGIKLVDDLTLYGFASKNIEKAKIYKEEFDALYYGNYDFFLNDDNVDAIYIATYNPSHYDLIKTSLLHHKNVICEKPMLSSKDEVLELFNIAKDNNVLLMEAMKSLFLPLTIKIKEIIDSNILGDIYYASASFVRAETFDHTHWIFDPKTGGALKDIGTYCASELNYLFGKPEVVGINKDEDICRTAQILIKYPNNIMGQIFVSNKISDNSELKIIGSKGNLISENFWKTGKAYYVVDGNKTEIETEYINDFYYELKHFSELLKYNQLESPVVSKDVSLDILTITVN